MSNALPVYEPLLGEREEAAVAACVRSGWVSSSGPLVAEFERRWAGYCGKRHGVSVSSGTAALQLAVAALGLGPGDEVVVPSFTIVSSVLAVLAAGATPVLVDADPETWTLDWRLLEARLTPRTRAVMAVHLYGHPCDMDRLAELCSRRGLVVIEDAAEAHGARYRGRLCGGLGHVSAFSFYANKLLTTGEGGMLLTDDEALAGRTRSLRNLCFGRERRYEHEEAGLSLRLSSLQAALGLAQLERLGEVLRRKRALSQAYDRLLAGLPLRRPPEKPWARSTRWLYGVVLDEGTLAPEEVARSLAGEGIETRPFFVGMHEQPVLLRKGLFRGERYPAAERLSRRGLCLPSGPGLSEADAERVAGALRRALSKAPA